jgi:hypothetical protein
MECKSGPATRVDRGRPEAKWSSTGDQHAQHAIVEWYVDSDWTLFGVTMDHIPGCSGWCGVRTNDNQLIEILESKGYTVKKSPRLKVVR